MVERGDAGPAIFEIVCFSRAGAVLGRTFELVRHGAKYDQRRTEPLPTLRGTYEVIRTDEVYSFAPDKIIGLITIVHADDITGRQPAPVVKRLTPLHVAEGMRNVYVISHEKVGGMLRELARDSWDTFPKVLLSPRIDSIKCFGERSGSGSGSGSGFGFGFGFYTRATRKRRKTPDGDSRAHHYDALVTRARDRRVTAMSALHVIARFRRFRVARVRSGSGSVFGFGFGFYTRATRKRRITSDDDSRAHHRDARVTRARDARVTTMSALHVIAHFRRFCVARETVLSRARPSPFCARP